MPRASSKQTTRTVAKKTRTAAQLEVAEAAVPSGEPDVSEYAIGDRVSHPKFGHGIVRAIDADKLTIEFAGKVVKQIVDYYVKRRS